MLEVRATAYIVPVDEQTLDSITPVVRIENTGTEAATVTGLFRIYRESTGLLVYSSALATSELAAGAPADVPALTPWDPAAPADDDYFILFDGQATNPDQGSPHVVDLHLSSYQFDIKPGPMGPAPAAHHVTHETGGMDEIDLTNLTGLTATPQTPDSHAASHQDGGADEIIVDNLSGVLADPQPPIAHGNADHTSVFEDQANKGIAGGYCSLPNPLDATLPLRADGTPALPEGTIISNDFVAISTSSGPLPFLGGAINAGSAAPIAGEPNHPGIMRASSSAGASSGYRWCIETQALLLAGSEYAIIHFRPLTLAGLVIRAGFHDSTTANDATDGAYIEIAQVAGVDGTLIGKTATAGVRSSTATNVVLVTNTWYKAIILVNAAANLVTFELYSEAGALLWSDTLNANIPTAAGQETGLALNASRTGGLTTICDVDCITARVARTLVR